MSDAIGERVLLPSFKMGKLIQTEPDGRKIFMEDSTGHLLCEHGERASTIGTWLLNERTARQNGTPVPPRTSSCHCQTTEGLHKSYNLAQQNPSPSTMSLFEHLQSLDTECKTFKGREARHIPFTQNELAAYVTVDGRILCKHGRARLTLLWDGKQTRKHGAAPKAACGCKAFPIPKRVGHHCMKLGACGDRRLTKMVEPSRTIAITDA